MTVEKIEQSIPHRSPMRLLDEIVSQTDSEIICRKTFREEEFFVQGHFPGHPLVPGVIQCECCLQAGAILLAGSALGGEHEHAVPVATRMDNVKFKRMVRPGETVEVHAVLKDRVSNAFFLTGKMTVGGKLATRLDFACSIANPAVADSNVADSGTAE
ncbi:3-hydroxyacyl-ACP dehydratase FabZ family protein [Novipirellula artificiosorum]|uniref:3-hydroxyacyl-[acyl-carrier-protein] dehydratase FabZ n=1 Tax=Novipirellula artificiosorum TaxID=2528016 RepID=A0A5C6DWW7_9BACT|nr:3-hydroxyacyl-ACP dehydratase FabZ family protein [Novipirellula artificiosorum]TWU41923.1 3-hydroxyacyl-[acyl-carrier-protein] dehydratase FabZ [Novipirellula artificiosorum]